jgi:hypothetical protein
MARKSTPTTKTTTKRKTSLKTRPIASTPYQASTPKDTNPAKLVIKWTKHVPQDQVSVFFMQGMVNRMIHGFIKYGHVMRKEYVPDSIPCLVQRLKKYKETGNTEWLIDIANYAMMEFMRPNHKKAHYRATSSEESPGAVLVGGQVVQNLLHRHHVRQAREGD